MHTKSENRNCNGNVLYAIGLRQRSESEAELLPLAFSRMSIAMGDLASIWSKVSDVSQLEGLLGSIGSSVSIPYKTSCGGKSKNERKDNKNLEYDKDLIAFVTHLKVFQACICIKDTLSCSVWRKTVAIVVPRHDTEVFLNVSI